jgi:hypothetical protein
MKKVADIWQRAIRRLKIAFNLGLQFLLFVFQQNALKASFSYWNEI